MFRLGAEVVFAIVALFGLNTAVKGARTHIYVATSAELDGVSGKYFEHCKEKASAIGAENISDRRRLWQLSEELTGIKNY